MASYNGRQIGGILKGSPYVEGDKKKTHFLFANDSLIFCKATQRECGHVLDILERYDRASKQKVNKNKTTVFFNKSTTESNKHEIKTTLGFQEIEHYEQYLGLPSLV